MKLCSTCKDGNKGAQNWQQEDSSRQGCSKVDDVGGVGLASIGLQRWILLHLCPQCSLQLPLELRQLLLTIFDLHHVVRDVYCHQTPGPLERTSVQIGQGLCYV